MEYLLEKWKDKLFEFIGLNFYIKKFKKTPLVTEDEKYKQITESSVFC